MICVINYIIHTFVYLETSAHKKNKVQFEYFFNSIALIYRRIRHRMYYPEISSLK